MSRFYSVKRDHGNMTMVGPNGSMVDVQHIYYAYARESEQVIYVGVMFYDLKGWFLIERHDADGSSRKVDVAIAQGPFETLDEVHFALSLYGVMHYNMDP